MSRSHSRQFFIILLTFFGLGIQACRNPLKAEKSGRDLLQAARSSHFRFDLSATRELLEQALAEEDGNPEDRAAAVRRLATISWLFDLDWEKAVGLLDKAEELDVGSFENSAARSRLLGHQGRHAEAQAAAREGIQRAQTDEEKLSAIVLLGQSVLEDIRGPSRRFREESRAVIEPVLELARLALRSDYGRLELSKIALNLALLTDDGEMALEAWHSYFWLPRPPLEKGPEASSTWESDRLAATFRTLRAEFSQWSGEDTPASSRVAVVLTLAKSGFLGAAALTASDPRLAPHLKIVNRPEIAELLGYSEFVEKLRVAVASFYRQRTGGAGSNADLRNDFQVLGRQLWSWLNWDRAVPDFTESAFLNELSRRFAVTVKFETRQGIASMNMGHRLIDLKHDVKQYGRQTEVRVVLLDRMVSNGYTSWFWDGMAATGGWVDEDGSIVQVHESYVDGPLQAWNDLADLTARENREKEILEASAQDDAIAVDTPHAYLPGLAHRIRFKEILRLKSELEAEGFRDDPLRTAFVSRLTALERASSIEAHEGRHALEKRTMRNWLRFPAEKEFLAKLSEVALSERPFLGLLGGILSSNIGDSSAHGKTNLRIMKGLVSWMREHQPEIKQLDRDRPFLPQLDRLADSQLIAAMRAMDPWAN